MKVFFQSAVKSIYSRKALAEDYVFTNHFLHSRSEVTYCRLQVCIQCSTKAPQKLLKNKVLNFSYIMNGGEIYFLELYNSYKDWSSDCTLNLLIFSYLCSKWSHSRCFSVISLCYVCQQRRSIFWEIFKPCFSLLSQAYGRIIREYFEIFQVEYIVGSPLLCFLTKCILHMLIST